MDLEKLLLPLAATLLGGLCTWAGLSARRAFKNVGRTELEIAADDLRAALEAERLALANSDPSDDAAAKKAVALAKARVEKAKRMKALLDAAGGDVE